MSTLRTGGLATSRWSPPGGPVPEERACPVRDRWATGSGERRPGRFDRQVVDLPREAERRATATLVNHRSAPDRLTDLLLEREIIDGTHVDGIRGHVAGGRLPVGRPATRVQSITGASRGATA